MNPATKRVVAWNANRMGMIGFSVGIASLLICEGSLVIGVLGAGLGLSELVANSSAGALSRWALGVGLSVSVLGGLLIIAWRIVRVTSRRPR
ncbi:MAG: hypothetical protein AAF493_07730 [Pseudomonadota bacterium]